MLKILCRFLHTSCIHLCFQCDRSSESSEAVEAVCRCLACFLDRSSHFPVVDHLIIAFHRLSAFVSLFHVVIGAAFNRVSFKLRLFHLPESRTENREPSTQIRTENCDKQRAHNSASTHHLSHTTAHRASVRYHERESQ